MVDLTQIVYVSRTTSRLDHITLEQVVALSHATNARLGVTGVLVIQGTSLMQLLEGDAPTLHPLLEKISRDTRHTDVTCLLTKRVSRRLYPEWGMGLSDFQSGLIVDRVRLTRMLDDVRRASDTKDYSIEARMLINDFVQQAHAAA